MCKTVLACSTGHFILSNYIQYMITETTDKKFDCAEGGHLIKICPETSYFHILQ